MEVILFSYSNNTGPLYAAGIVARAVGESGSKVEISSCSNLPFENTVSTDNWIVQAYGSMSKYSRVGGIAGFATVCTISSCTNNRGCMVELLPGNLSEATQTSCCSVSGYYCGGIAGLIESSTVTSSNNNAAVHLYGSFGYSTSSPNNCNQNAACGIAGAGNNSTLQNCTNGYSKGSGDELNGIVQFKNYYTNTQSRLTVGGILGLETTNKCTISGCTNNAIVSGSKKQASSWDSTYKDNGRVGGICGYPAAGAAISSCNNYGYVRGFRCINGAIVGLTNSSKKPDISNCKVGGYVRLSMTNETNTKLSTSGTSLWSSWIVGDGTSNWTGTGNSYGN